MTVEPFSATAPLKSVKGTAAKPGITFVGDGNTGIFSPNADQIAVTTGGTQRLLIGADGTITLTNNFSLPLGSAANPSLFFGTDSNTGVYSPGADQVAISTGGTQRLTTTTTEVASTLPVLHPLGAAATPSLTFAGDTNTGIYSPGADQVAISTNGTGRLFVSSAGNVGVGNTAPAMSLHVGPGASSFTTPDGAGVNFTPQIFNSQTSGVAGVGVGVVEGTNNRRASLFVDQPNGIWGLSASYSSGEPSFVIRAASSERLRIDSSGRLGLGTSSPAEILHLGGSSAQNIRINGNTNAMYLGTVGDTTQVAVNRRPTDGTIPNSARGTAFININGLSTGGSIELATSTAANTGATTALTVDSSQRVGINTGSPGTTLEVNGTISQTSQGTSSAQYWAVNSGGTFYYAIDNSTGSSFGAAYAAALWHSGNRPMLFATNNSEKMRLDASGRLGLGTSAPTYTLDVVGFGPQSIRVASADGDLAILRMLSNGNNEWSLASDTVMRFRKDSTEYMRLDSNGRLGLGTTSPSTLLHLSSATGSATPTPTELRIATTTNASDWSTTLPWGRLSFYSADISGAGPKTHAAIDVTASSAAKLLSTFDFKIAEATTGSLVNGFSLISGNSAANVSLRMGAGTNGIQFNGQTDTGINSGTQTLQFTTAGSERARIDSSGRVGIGTTGPTAILHTVNTSAGAATIGAFLQNSNTSANTEIRIAFAGNTQAATDNRHAYIGGINTEASNNATALTFGTNANGAVPTEKMRLDTSGRLLVGTSSARANFQNTTGTAALQIEGVSNASSSFSVTRNSSVAGPLIRLARSAGNAIGSNTILTSSDPEIGVINFEGNDGSEFVIGAQISAAVDGTPGANDMPGRIVLSTTADGASTPTERMRIDSSGRVGIGTTGPASTLHVQGTISALGNGSAPLFWGNTSPLGALTYNGTDVLIQAQGASSGNIAFLYGASERARIDTSGRLLVGTSTSISVGNIIGGAQFASASTFGTTSAYYSNSSTGSIFSLGKSRATAVGSLAIVQAGDILGEIRFAGDDGTDLNSYGASIRAIVDGTPGVNDMPGMLLFETTADGASSPTERMRITNGGRVGIGTTSPSTLLHLNTGTEATAITVAAASSTGAQLLLGIGTKSTNTPAISSNANGLDIGTTDANPLTFFTNGIANERLRIDSSGRLLVGTSTSGGAEKLVVVAGSSTATGDVLIRGLSSRGQGVLALQSHFVISSNFISGDKLGIIKFTSSDSAEFATITGEVDGTASTNDYPGRLVFSTTADGASSPTERMRITNAGRVGIGTTSPATPLHTKGTLRIERLDASTQWAEIYHSGSLNYYLAKNNATSTYGSHVFLSGNNSTDVEHARIDSSGRLLVGTTSVLAETNLSAQFGTASTSGSITSISVGEGARIFRGRVPNSNSSLKTTTATFQFSGTYGAAMIEIDIVGGLAQAAIGRYLLMVSCDTAGGQTAKLTGGSSITTVLSSGWNAPVFTSSGASSTPTFTVAFTRATGVDTEVWDAYLTITARTVSNSHNRVCSLTSLTTS